MAWFERGLKDHLAPTLVLWALSQARNHSATASVVPPHIFGCGSYCRARCPWKACLPDKALVPSSWCGKAVFHNFIYKHTCKYSLLSQNQNFLDRQSIRFGNWKPKIKTCFEQRQPKPLLLERNPKTCKPTTPCPAQGCVTSQWKPKASMGTGCCTCRQRKMARLGAYSEDCFRMFLSFILCFSSFFFFKQLHAFSSGFKAMVSQYCTTGVEICLRACGGHGYSLLSGLPSLYTKILASCIYEGENTILLLQTAR